MKEQERYRLAYKLLDVLKEESKMDFKTEFLACMTLLSMVFASREETVDVFLDGFENEMKKIVKGARKMLIEASKEK